MIRTRVGLFIVGGALSATAYGHHGFGSFDMTKDITITGNVEKMEFVNPHSWLYLNVTDKGQEGHWRCEMRAATVLKRSGWSPEMFQVGQKITIGASPDRADPRSCYLSTVSWPDGTTMNRYGQRERTEAVAHAPRELHLPSGELNISGDWAPEQLVMTDPRGQAGTLVPLSTASEFKPGEVPEGQAPIAGARNAVQGSPPPPSSRPGPVELTEAGKAAAVGFDPRAPKDNPRLRCETTSIVFDWTFDGPVNRITQTGDTITLQYGQLGFTRTIHMNQQHPANIVPSRGGHSIGRWDNDVLVVDTVGFLPGILTGSTLHSDKLHVVERFSYDPQKVAITRAYSADDAAYFVGQLTGSDTIFEADVAYSPDACSDQTFVNFAQKQAAQEPVKDAPASAPAKPWWKFWD